MDLELKNKRVLITGASRGIGAAIARSFLLEGARVCIVSRGSKNLYDTEALLRLEFENKLVHAQSCDCTSLDEMKVLKHNINKKWKGLDIVVANVGDGESVSEPISNNNQWKKIWDKNFETSLNTARTFLPSLKETKGCFLFISSIAGIEAIGAPVDYSTAKTAVIALAKNMARKLGEDVRINVLAPGNIFFPEGAWEKKVKDDPIKIKEYINNTVPMKRFGTPEDIADSAVFLCSSRAKFITGSILVVDGGQTVRIF